MKLQLKELTTKQEMLAQYPVMQYLYQFSLEKYNTYLDDMIPNNYKQIAVLKVMMCCCSGTKLWSGFRN
jgi:hypothetical protein